MIIPIVVAIAIIVYFSIGSVTMVKFVASDMQHYWHVGADYKPEDLSQAIVAGGVRAIVWPLTFTLTGIRKTIERSAYRIAVKWWDEHQDDPRSDADDFGVIETTTTEHAPRHGR